MQNGGALLALAVHGLMVSADFVPVDESGRVLWNQLGALSRC